MEKEKSEKKKSVYDIVTGQVISLLIRGTVPWRQPWGRREKPQNLLNRIPYKGLNAMVLATCGFERNLFITPNQLKEMKARWKQGERPFQITFWKFPDPKELENLPEDEKEKKLRPVLRYYDVFNISQCEGIPEKLIPSLELKENNPIESCAKIVANMPNPPRIDHIYDRAYYTPSMDVVNMPQMKLFDSSENYYATLFHELVHSTGHSTRLNRPEGMKGLPFNEDYSLEELIAELGACFLETEAGIEKPLIEQNAAYIQHWLRELNNDHRLIVFAAVQAQKAADYILSAPLNGKEVSEQESGQQKERTKRRPRGTKVKIAETEEHPTFSTH